jgi:hypothetical protein
VAAPPHAKVGERAASAGRPIVAGVAPFLRTLPARATSADLWAGVEALTAAVTRAAEDVTVVTAPISPTSKPEGYWD